MSAKQLNVPAEILKLVCDTSDGTITAVDACYKVHSLIEQVGKEIIGESEEPDPEESNTVVAAINNSRIKLRAAQRQTLATILGKEK